jgi:hypothetical protein
VEQRVGLVLGADAGVDVGEFVSTVGGGASRLGL